MRVRVLRCIPPAWVALAALGCGGGADSAGPPVPAVATASARLRQVEVALPFVGKAEPTRAVTLVALAEGRIVAVHAADGAYVKTGEVLFEIGGDRVASQGSALEVGVEAAVRRAEAATKHQAQANRRKASHLAVPGEGFAATEELAAAQAHLASARTELQRFRASLSVKAPISGRFANRRVSRGQVVRPGVVLGEILEIGSIRIDAQLVPRPGLNPAVGQAAVIEGADGSQIAAAVAGAQPTASAAGTVRVWLTGDELRSLAPGTAVRGRITATVHERAVTVPTSAVVRDSEDRPLVFVAAGGTFTRRSVTTGEEGDGWVEITSGLEAGEAVVTRGAYELYWSSFGKEYKVAD